MARVGADDRPGQRLSAPARDGATALFEVLRAWAVDRLFICPGSTEAAVLEASLRFPDVALVPTSHESVAVAMADGYARLRGSPAVVYVHTHLGLANALAHLSCARLERSPVVVLCGLKATGLHERAGFTTTSDVRALARQFTRWEWQSLRAEAVAADVERALCAAATTPGGPAFVAIPQDLLEADAGAEPARSSPTPRVRPDPERVRAAAAVLSEARRPLIVAGAEVDRAGAWAQVAALARRLGAPVVLEDRRTIERAPPTATVPAYAGLLDRESAAVRGADAILLAGARTPTRFSAGEPAMLPSQTPLVHLCADPDEPGRVHQTAVALAGDAGLALSDIAAALDDGRVAAADAAAFRAAAEADHRERSERARRRAEADAARVPVAVPALMARLVAALPPGALLVDDSVTSKAALLTHALGPGGRWRYLTTAGGSLGWGAGAALGAALARPAEPVMAVLGDGGFQFGMPALWTAVRERIAITYVVVNNRSYAAVKAAMVRLGGDAAAAGPLPATDLSGPRIADIAAGFGALGRRVDALDELDAALAAARAFAGPSVIEVITDPDDHGPL